MLSSLRFSVCGQEKDEDSQCRFKKKTFLKAFFCVTYMFISEAAAH